MQAAGADQPSEACGSPGGQPHGAGYLPLTPTRGLG